MTTIRKFCCHDLLGFASVTLDHLTLNREMSVYLKWLSTWPDYCLKSFQCGYEVIRITQDFYMNDKDEDIDSYEMRKLLSEEEGINYSTVDQLLSLRNSYTTD